MSDIEKREEAVRAWAISHAGDGFDITNEKRAAFRDGFDAAALPADHSEAARQLVACASAHTAAVTRESALRAISHVELHNGPGRADDARSMLAGASPADHSGDSADMVAEPVEDARENNNG